jgi:hypothetical protein
MDGPRNNILSVLEPKWVTEILWHVCLVNVTYGLALHQNVKKKTQNYEVQQKGHASIMRFKTGYAAMHL